MKRRGAVIIAALEVVGGFAGLAIASQLALKSISLPAAALVFGLVGLPMLLSLRAGQLLWKGEARGRALSMLVQLCQLPVVQLGAFRYDFFVGGRLALLWKTSDVFPRVDLGAGLSMQFSGPELPTAVGVNLVALWALWYLWRTALPNPQMQPTGRRGRPSARASAF